MTKSLRNVLTSLFLILLISGCSINEPKTQTVEVREPVFPPEQFLEDCKATFKSRKMKHIIVGLDAALRECNAQIDGIIDWKSEMKKESKSTEKGD